MSNIQLVNNSYESNFYKHLESSIKTSKQFFFSVAFISDAAIQLLTDAFRYCESKGIKGKILTTNYMFGTNPNALKRLLSFSNLEVRVYNITSEKQRGFHTKGYIFENDDNYKVIVGSSNLTSRAMKTNYEWNVSYISKFDNDLSSKLLSEFDDMWHLKDSVPLTHTYVEQYEKSYHNNVYTYKKQSEFLEQFVAFLKDYNDVDFINKVAEALEITETEIHSNIDLITKPEEIEPNRMQEIALEGLYKIRQNGGNKGLIIAATGTGKTYLAAFDALQMNPKKLLFVVHREKILKDAERTFKHVNREVNTGLYTGNFKELDKDYVFASIQTLSRDNNLYQLKEDHFDYIVIDEAHRAAAPTYKKVLEHFHPKFLLGMTATPERTDTNSIFELFDNQIAAEIRLRDALEERMVVPFHYFGITDAVTDLSDIDTNKDIDVLSERLNIKARVDLIVENIKKYGHSGDKTKALGFCADIKHAIYMADKFNELGLESVALTGLSTQADREICVNRLEDDNDTLSYIFTVDIFNEGIDIPTVNLVLMLRPTQSPIIFTQQLGRGLRLHPAKDYLTILDFIGNHNKSFMIPIALSGDISYDKDDLLVDTATDFMNIPGDVFIRLDEKTKEQILYQLERYNFNELKNLKELYFNVKKDTKTVPHLIDFSFDGLDPVRFIDKSKSYFEFVLKVDDTFSQYQSQINDDYIAIIRFIDSLLPLKRIYEHLIIQALLSSDKIGKEELFKQSFEYINNPSMDDLEHALKHLSLELLGESDRKKYRALLTYDEDNIMQTQVFNKIIKNHLFNSFISSSVEYGINRYIHEFGRVQNEYPSFKLYYKYKIKELTQIIRYPKIFVIQSGLFKYDNNFFLLVTLEKGNVKDEIDYKDMFIDNKTFQWESPNNTRALSETGQNLIHHKARNRNIHLFVKKGGKNTDIYSKELIYLGTVEYINHKGEKPIRFDFRMHNQVPKEVYLRLTKESKSNENN